MEFEIDIVRNTDCEAEDDLLFAVVKETVSRSGLPSFSVVSRVGLGIALVSDMEIRELNRTYRGKDAPTDVLSFSEHEGKKIGPDETGTVFLGDLVIAPDFVARAAEGDRVPFRKELAFVCSHGILHLLGLDHSPEMFRIQDDVTDAVIVSD